MRLAKLCLTASILIATGTGAAAVEMVRPYEALELSRRAMIELDKRQKREDVERQTRVKEQEAQRKREEAEQRKREREEKAQQETQRKRDAAAAKADQGARPSPANLPPQPSAAPGAQTAETAEPRRQPDISFAPPQQQVQAKHPQPLAQNAASARPQVNVKLADPQASAQAPTAPPRATTEAAERQLRVQNAPPARQQVGAQPPTEPPLATGQADEHRPQASVEPTESRVGVNQGQGEPQGRVQSGSPPAAGATPDNVPSAAPAAIAVSRLKRMNLYNERGDKLGDVERVVQSADGHFHIVIGAGGFLGIRERDVRIPLEQVTVRGDRLVIQDLTDDQVRIMPVFDRKDRTYRELARNTTVPIGDIGNTAHP
jgi:sporulation protein YlmC with PRC-barrel domain